MLGGRARVEGGPVNRVSRFAIAAIWLPAMLLAQPTESPLALLRVEGGKVGWDGVELGM